MTPRPNAARVTAAWTDGWRRVGRAPLVLVGVFALTLAAGVPFAMAMRGLLASDLGRSLVAARAAADVDYDWWQEFASGATGLGTTFRTVIIGFASTLDGVSAVLDARPLLVPIAAAAAGYLLAWTFLLGGILDRYARQRPTRGHGFFSACGVHVFRFVRLGVPVGLAYWWLFAYVHPWLFTSRFTALTETLDVEREAFAWRAGLYVVFGVLLVGVNLLADYAKIRIVVEDRRSAAGALAASWRFVAARPGPVLGLYALNALTFAGLLAVWAAAAPGVPGDGARAWIAFGWSQLFLAARLALKLHFLASQTAIFQASLAHATYVARPLPVWPDSPAAELVSVGDSSAVR